MQETAVSGPEQADTAIQRASQAGGAQTALQHQVQQQAAAIDALQTQLASLLQQAPPAAPRDTLQGPAQAPNAVPDSSHVHQDISQDGDAAPPTFQAVVPMEPAASTRPSVQQAAGSCTNAAITSSASQSVEANCSDGMGTSDQQMMSSNDQQMMPSSAGSVPKKQNGERGQVDAGRLSVPVDSEETARQQIAPKQAQQTKKPSNSCARQQEGEGMLPSWLTVKWCNAPHRFL